MTEKKWIAGVAAGVAYWVGAPAWVVRLLWALAVMCYGVGALLYILLWIFMPKWEETPFNYEKTAGG